MNTRTLLFALALAACVVFFGTQTASAHGPGYYGHHAPGFSIQIGNYGFGYGLPVHYCTPPIIVAPSMRPPVVIVAAPRGPRVIHTSPIRYVGPRRW